MADTRKMDLNGEVIGLRIVLHLWHMNIYRYIVFLSKTAADQCIFVSLLKHMIFGH